MDKWYILNVYTFCKSLCVINVGSHMVYHAALIRFTMGSPYTVYHGEPIRFTMGPHTVYHGDPIRFTMGPHTVYHGVTIRFTMGSPYGLPWGPHIYFTFIWSDLVGWVHNSWFIFSRLIYNGRGSFKNKCVFNIKIPRIRRYIVC